MQNTFDGFCEKFLKLRESRVPLVVVTLVGVRGSVPQNLGARMIVGSGQVLFGTIGGGKLEQRCIESAEELRNSKNDAFAKTVSWNLQTDIGMSCGGEVTLLLERHDPTSTWSISVFGAGHVSQELCPLLMRLDCDLTVIDPRADWLNKLPTETHRLRKILREDMKSVLNELSSNSFVLLLTMGHDHDLPILQRALAEFYFPFLGVIGSRPKRARLERELREKGYTGEMSFFCPLGEEFGSNAPMEIALSIVAQLLKRRDLLRAEK